MRILRDLVASVNKLTVSSYEGNPIHITINPANLEKGCFYVAEPTKVQLLKIKSGMYPELSKDSSLVEDLTGGSYMSLSDLMLRYVNSDFMKTASPLAIDPDEAEKVAGYVHRQLSESNAFDYDLLKDLVKHSKSPLISDRERTEFLVRMKDHAYIRVFHGYRRGTLDPKISGANLWHWMDVISALEYLGDSEDRGWYLTGDFLKYVMPKLAKPRTAVQRANYRD